MIQIKPNMLDKDGNLFYFYGFFKAANKHCDYINRKDAAIIGAWILSAQDKALKLMNRCSFDCIINIVSDTTETVNYLLDCVVRGDNLCATI